MQNNAANRERLSTAIVDGFDLDHLIDIATQSLAKDMEGWTQSQFKLEWENVFHEIQTEEEQE